MAPGAFAAQRIGTVIHLPSKMPPISIASAGKTMLAIDRSGAVFRSQDSGATWQSVAKQWTGRAMIVRAPVALGNQSESERTASADSTQGGSGGGGAWTIGSVFELLNDQSQVWHSADGVTWTAK